MNRVLDQVKKALREIGEPIPDSLLTEDERFESKSRILLKKYEETIRGYAQAKNVAQQALQRFTGASLEFVKAMDSDWLEEWSHAVAKTRFAYERHHALRKDNLTPHEIETARIYPIGKIHPVPRNNFIYCLWHSEKTPSLHITKNLYYCHGCGAGGDVISFIQKRDNLSFVEAVRKLSVL